MNGAVFDSWSDSSNAEEQKEARAEGYDGQTHSTPVVATGGIFRRGRIETKTQSQLIPGRFLGAEGKEEWINFDKPTLDGPWDRHAVTAMLNIASTSSATNSSIVNNAWALIVEGGSNDTSKMSVANGIGWDKSIKLW